MLLNELRYLPHQGKWFNPTPNAFGCQILVPGTADGPDPESLEMVERLHVRLTIVQNDAIGFLRFHFAMSGAYHLRGIEVLPIADRHRNRIFLYFGNEDDGYMWFEVAVAEDNFSPKLGMVKYF